MKLGTSSSPLPKMKCHLSFYKNENCPTSNGCRVESTVYVQRDCSNGMFVFQLVPVCYKMVFSIGLWWDGMQRAHVIKTEVSALGTGVCLSASLRLGFTAVFTGKSAKKCFHCSHFLSKIPYISCFEWCNHHDNVIFLLLRLFVAMNETLSFGLSEFCFYWSCSEAAAWWLQLKWS